MEFSSSTKSLDVLGIGFPVAKYGLDVIECWHIVIQKVPILCKDINLYKKDNMKLGIFVEVLEDLSTKSIDDVGCLLLNKDKLQ
jgi:hypothetical protein